MKEYWYINDFVNGFAEVQLNKKYGFINKKYEEICEIKYDMVWNFNDDFAKVSLGNKYGYINKYGIEVIECKYKFNIAMKLIEKYKYNQKRIDKIKTII